jgi:hypothetical protein
MSKEIIEKLDAIEAKQAESIAAVEAKIPAAIDAVKAEMSEMVAALEAKVAAIPAASSSQRKSQICSPRCEPFG